jgi:cellulose synthase/poly-beta-1,6-N-acetylglucosamine synthase-like glycosyltransferase
MTTLLLLLCLAALVYAWGAYPLILRVMAGRAAPDLPAASGPAAHPVVALLISAHNEEEVIQSRLQNLVALDYPAERLIVYLGVDGSTDRTAALAGEFIRSHPAFRLVVGDVCRGKPAMLNVLYRLMEQECTAATGARRQVDIVAFSDANTMFERDAIHRLMLPFRDPRIGGVCGKLVFGSTGREETDEGFYWRQENRLKQAESRLDSCLGANGGIYALRRDLFWKALPDNTIVDDFVLGMKVREQGWRMVYEPRAVAQEDLPERVADEWSRRVRIGRGDFQALWLCRRCLLPRYGAFAWIFWSHKVLRWLTPHLVLGIVGCSVVAVSSGAGVPFPLPAFLPHLSILGVMGLLAAAWMGTWVRLFRPVRYFVLMQVALFIGFLRFCRGDVSGTWKRTERGDGGR